MVRLRSFLSGACLVLIACSGDGDDGVDSGNPADAALAEDGGGDMDSAVGDASVESDSGAHDAAAGDASGPGPDASGPSPDASDPVADASGPDASDAAPDSGPPRIEASVNPETGDDQNAGTSGSPVKTLQRAFELVGEHGLVWLEPGTFTNATEGLTDTGIYTGRNVPADTLIRAADDGVSVGITLQFPAGGGLEGVSLDTGAVGRVMVSGGSVSLREVTWVRSSVGGVTTGLEVTGTGKVVLEPGDDPDHNYLGAPGSLSALASLRGSAELTIEGGVLDGATGTGFGHIIDMADATKLTLRDFTLSNQSGALVSGGAAVWMGGAECNVLIEDSRIDLGNNAGGSACVVQDDNYVATPAVNASLTIRDSVLTRCAGSAVQLREGAPDVLIEDSELSASSNRLGIEAGQIGFDSVKVAGRPNLTLVNTVIRGNYLGGIAMNGGGVLSVTGGSVTMNGGASGRGGLWLEGVFPYAVSVRGVSITDNTGPGGYAGAWLAGDATSTFDLGTADSPGNNTLTGNQPTQISMRVAAGVIVSAVGNTWAASQGADAEGHYTVDGALCAGADPCDQTTGADVNFTFAGAGAGAALRLAAE